MEKKLFLGIGLIFVICISLLAGCSTSSTTSPAAGNATPAASAPAAQNSPTPPAVNAAGAAVNLPSFADLLNVAEHSVVKIDVSGTTTNFFGRTIQQQGAGSGWIMDANGTIVTNFHVIEGATSITVTTLDGKTYPAQVLNSDSNSDLALIKINATGLASIKIGDASKLRVGDWVLALGNPLGEGIIATEGIVSRLKVSLSDVSSAQTYSDLIETSAAINPGNSGGPLINLSGEVIGITSVKVSASGIEGMGYAINMVDAVPVIQKLSSSTQ